MNKKPLIVYSALLVLGCGSLTFEQSAHASGFGDMMNPGKWFGGNNRSRRYDDDYYYDRYRYGGYGPGYGYSPYGYGGGYGPYGGYGGWPGYGYGAPGYNQQKSETPLPPIPQ